MNDIPTHSGPRSKAAKSPDAPTGDLSAEWLRPIASDAPSGPSLEYDAEFAVLAARLAPKADVQYGGFTAAAPEPDWKEIERDCRRLLLRTKDLNLLLWFTRSRTAQAGAKGLLQGLTAMQRLCEQFGDTLHPQLHIDGLFEPMVRANAIAGLCDPEGLLGDVREVIIASGTAQRLKVKDVERAFQRPRQLQALEPQSVQRQLADLFQRQDEQLLALRKCASCVQYLQTWAQESLPGEAPSLQPLLAVLMPLLTSIDATVLDAPSPTETEAPPGIHAAAQLTAEAVPATAQPQARPQSPDSLPQALHSRADVWNSLVRTREWLVANEPSSPVLPLLKQAERMWGRRFSEVAHMIPADLLKAWDQDD